MNKRSVAGIAIRQGRLFLGQRLPGGDLGSKWEFPGGKCEAGESDAEALKREYQEEFGLAIDVVAPICTSNFTHHGHHYDLAAWEISFAGTPVVLKEHSQIAWLELSELAGLDLADSDTTLVSGILAYLKREDAIGTGG
jgi:8-oxo-dGTP diphosphatase